jgi:hypothetical protein
VHRQIFEGDETIDYAFMGQDPDVADNRWLREALENQVLASRPEGDQITPVQQEGKAR